MAFNVYPNDTLIHNNLASYYIQAIEERTRVISGIKGEVELDIEEINNDAEIIIIRKKFGVFLEEANTYSVTYIMQQLPAYLLKEKGILLIKDGKFAEGFTFLIKEAQMPLLAIKLGEGCYIKTRKVVIINELIKCLLSCQKEGNCLRMATAMMERYFDACSASSLVEAIPEEIELEKISIALGRIIEKELSNDNRLLLEENCRDYVLSTIKEREYKIKKKYWRIEEGAKCIKCGNPVSYNEALFISYNGNIWHYGCEHGKNK